MGIRDEAATLDVVLAAWYVVNEVERKAVEKATREAEAGSGRQTTDAEFDEHLERSTKCLRAGGHSFEDGKCARCGLQTRDGVSAGPGYPIGDTGFVTKASPRVLCEHVYAPLNDGWMKCAECGYMKQKRYCEHRYFTTRPDGSLLCQGCGSVGN